MSCRAMTAHRTLFSPVPCRRIMSSSDVSWPFSLTSSQHCIRNVASSARRRCLSRSSNLSPIWTAIFPPPSGRPLRSVPFVILALLRVESRASKESMDWSNFLPSVSRVWSCCISALRTDVRRSVSRAPRSSESVASCDRASTQG